MSSIDKKTKDSLREIFSSQFQNLNHQNNEDGDSHNELLGESVLTNINNIKINDISYGKIVRTLNAKIEALVNSKDGLELPIGAKFIFSRKELEAVDIINSIFQIASQSESDQVSALINKVKIISEVITKKSSVLNNELANLKLIIDAQPDSDDPNHVQRMNLLRQVYTFNLIRIRSIEQLLSKGSATLTDAQKYYKYTKPNMDFSIQSKIKMADIDKAMNTFKAGYLEKVKFFNLSLNLIGLLLQLWFFVFSIFCILYALIILGFKIDQVSRFYNFIFCFVAVATIYSVINIIVNISKYYNSSYMSVLKSSKFDYKKYKRDSKKFNSLIIKLFAPILAFIPFLTAEKYKVYFADLSSPILIILFNIIVWKVFNLSINRFDQRWLEVSYRLNEVYLFYIESQDELRSSEEKVN